MRGRPGCPTEQKKTSVGATAGSPPLFYKERLGTESPPHPPQCAHWGTFPPRGRLWGGGSAARRSWDYYGSHVYPLIWNLSFTKMLSSIFFSKMRPKSVLVYRRKLPLCRIRNNHHKNQRVGTSGHKNPGPGRSPGVLSSDFLQRKSGPRPGPGGQRGAAPQGGFGGTHPEGTQHRAAPGRWSGFGPAQVQTCNVGSRPVPGGGSRLSLEKARTQRVAGGPPPPLG